MIERRELRAEVEARNDVGPLRKKSLQVVLRPHIYARTLPVSVVLLDQRDSVDRKASRSGNDRYVNR